MGDARLAQLDETQPLEQADETQLAMFDPWVMLAGHGMYLGTTLTIYFFYRNVTPADSLALWSKIAVAALSVSTVFCIAFFLRRPSPLEVVRVWRKLDKRLTHVFDLVAVASIFLLFEHGGEAHRLVALAFCIGYGPMQLIIDPENLWANRSSVALILGAFALKLFIMKHEAALILSVLFLLYGSMLLFAANVFHKTFHATVAQKHQSERAQSQVRAALAEVSKSRDAKTRFIAMASHDLAHPLQAAGLFALELESSFGKSEKPKALRLLQQALSGAQVQVGHMLHFMRLESDTVEPNLDFSEVGKTVSEAVQRWQPEARKRRVDLRMVHSTLGVVTDNALLLRAVDNILANALVHSNGSKILVGCRRSDSKVVVWIIDNGRGIPAHQREAIFQDFVQGENAEIVGFGLGLASARRIAELLGGRVAIDGRWKNGSAFYIELERSIK